MPQPSSATPFLASVRVPCSTSNLGPGFDLLGLALSMHLVAEVVRENRGPDAAHSFERFGTFAGELAGEACERVVEAFASAAARLDQRAAFHIRVQHDIPVGRGFGSSGAATAAGLLLARELSGQDVALDRLLAWGIELEGHPDNVTASLLGGLTLCHPDPDGAGPAYFRSPVHPAIHVALAWPAEPLETARARAALPGSIAFADAVENPRRLALLLEGLRTGDARLLAAGGEDRLHVSRRLELIPGARAALAAAREAGAWLATISGAGSGLVALAAEDRVEAVAAAMATSLRSETGFGEARVVDVVREPATALRMAP